MPEPVLTYRGVVYPWHCDQVGRMNAMWYVGKFDVEKKVVKFRQKDTDEWSVYTPLAKESDRARQFFGGKWPRPLSRCVLGSTQLLGKMRK